MPRLAIVATAASLVLSVAAAPAQRLATACPGSLAACPALGGSGIECIDHQTNLSQCGACRLAGGIDCSALPGVASAGCVDGRCETWACSPGFDWLEETKSCVPGYGTSS
ncbi:hypothetical protein JCM21900_003273 [Sporobolomyces salmonicolor]